MADATCKLKKIVKAEIAPVADVYIAINVFPMKLFTLFLQFVSSDEKCIFAAVLV
jgi:hypothetical protein